MKTPVCYLCDIKCHECDKKGATYRSPWHEFTLCPHPLCERCWRRKENDLFKRMEKWLQLKKLEK